MTQYTFGFLGLGLIGGSIARALKAHDESNRIIAFDTDRKSLTKAYEDGVVDVLVSDIDSRFSECDFVFADASGAFSAVQVCYELAPENRERELAGLLGALRQFGLREGTIVTLRQSDFAREDGRAIRVVPAHEWLVD
jgi:predicted dinucleotide-utilizing enzyme